MKECETTDKYLVLRLKALYFRFIFMILNVHLTGAIFQTGLPSSRGAQIRLLEVLLESTHGGDEVEEPFLVHLSQ